MTGDACFAHYYSPNSKEPVDNRLTYCPLRATITAYKPNPSSMSKISLAGVTLALSLLFVPASFVRAEDFSLVSLSPKGKVTLTAQVGGFAGKGSSVSAPPGASITLNWIVPAGWKGCYSNWDTNIITASGNKAGTIPTALTGRSFVLTCFGVGQAQTVAVRVNVVKPDLAVVRFSAVGKELIPETGAVPARPAIAERKDTQGRVIQAAVPVAPAIPATPKNTYKGGEGAITFSAVVKNVSKSSIPAGTPIQVVYEAAQSKSAANWLSMSTVSLETNLAIDPGATPNVRAYVHTTTTGGPWFFRVRADSENKLDESNEKNNITVPIGPYFFR